MRVFSKTLAGYATVDKLKFITQSINYEIIIGSDEIDNCNEPKLLLVRPCFKSIKAIVFSTVQEHYKRSSHEYRLAIVKIDTPIFIDATFWYEWIFCFVL